MKHKSRNAQLSLFFIVGILLLFAIILLGITKSIINESRIRIEAKNDLDQRIVNDGLKSYIEDCMESIAINEIEKALIQGGRLNISGQETINTSINHYGKKVENVTFLIERPSKEKQDIKVGGTSYIEIYEVPPQYPLPQTSIDLLSNAYSSKLIDAFLSIGDELLLNNSFYSGYIGYNNAEKLCRNTTENLEWGNLDNSLSRKPCIEEGINGIRELEPYSRSDALKEQLETAISNEMPKCVNNEIVKNVLGINYSMSEKPIVRISFNPRKTEIKAEYEFNFTYKNRYISVMKEFDTNINIPLRRISNALLVIAQKESRDPEFNITSIDALKRIDSMISNVERINCSDERMICKNSDDYLIKIDYPEKISNENLSIYFGVKNRYPVLDYIHKPCGFRYNDKEIDLCVRENDTITINPIGIDPDEYLVYYNYEGWKETFDEYFNRSKCLRYGGSIDCSDINKIRNAIERIDVEPRNWTNSYLYQITHRNASYRTNENDTGIHFLEVIVRDPQGRIDYQNVSILVIDLPKPNISVNSIYNDIPSDWLSIEDPFILNASNSEPSIIGELIQMNYIWNDSLNEFNIETSNDELMLPFEEYTSEVLENMRNQILKQAIDRVFYLQLNETLRVGNRIENLFSEKIEKNVKVTQCLPHRSTEPIYPYNNLQGFDKLFMGNHTCCSDDGSILSGNTCYSTSIAKMGIKTYRRIEELKSRVNSDANENINNELLNIWSSLVNNRWNSDYANDYLNISFERLCSGERGNICDGDINLRLVKHMEASDNPLLPSWINNGEVIDRCEYYDENGNLIELSDDSFLHHFGQKNDNHCWEGSVCYNNIAINALTCSNGGCTMYEGLNENIDCSGLDECRSTNNGKLYAVHTCNIGNGEAYCEEELVDPDMNEDYCNACSETWINNHCCGDDANEYITNGIIGNNGCCGMDQCFNDITNNCVGEGTTISYGGNNYECICNSEKGNGGNGCYWEKQ